MTEITKTQQNLARKNHFKPRWAILLVVAILCISPVFAMDWDNKLTYLDEDLKVEFDNTFLRLFETSHIGSAELKSHISVDEIKKVVAGRNVPIFYDFDFAGLYEDGLGGEMYFIDMKTGEEVNRAWNYVYWGDAQRDVYGDINCKSIYKENGTGYDCEQVITGTETYQTWLDYNTKDIPKGQISCSCSCAF